MMRLRKNRRNEKVEANATKWRENKRFLAEKLLKSTKSSF